MCSLSLVEMLDGDVDTGSSFLDPSQSALDVHGAMFFFLSTGAVNHKVGITEEGQSCCSRSVAHYVKTQSLDQE